jgi:hypothetical protein
MEHREALINLANHLDVARMQANDIEDTALKTRVYVDIVNALKDTLVLITGDQERAEKVYASILDGNTAERALEWEAGERENPTGPKFPDVQVQLTGEDGNAFFIIGRVSQALRRAGHGEVIQEFQNEAMSGDYNHVLQTVMRWVEVS